MGIFGSVSSKAVDEFAKSLARDLAQQCPLGPQSNGRPEVSAKRLAAAIEEVCRKALRFRQEHKLGLYKKARLGNAFRWELSELGYDKLFVEDATQRVVVHISRQ